MNDFAVVDTIQIDDETRLRVYVDPYGENPLDWGHDASFYEIDSYDVRHRYELERDPVAEVAYEAQLKVRCGEWTEEQRDRAVHIYMVLTDNVQDFVVRDWRGYSQSDWGTYFGVGEDAEWLWGTYAAWLRGDVYTVVLEKLEHFSNKQETIEMDIWCEVDSLSGNYLDDTYTALTVAKEQFGVGE